MSDKPRFQILVCDGPSCGVCHGSDDIKRDLEKKVAADADLKERVGVIDFCCFGRCGEGPNLLVRPLSAKESLDDEPSIDALDGVRGFYTEVDADRMGRIVEEHCRTGEPIDDAVEEY